MNLHQESDPNPRAGTPEQPAAPGSHHFILPRLDPDAPLTAAEIAELGARLRDIAARHHVYIPTGTHVASTAAPKSSAPIAESRPGARRTEVDSSNRSSSTRSGDVAMNETPTTAESATPATPAAPVSKTKAKKAPAAKKTKGNGKAKPEMKDPSLFHSSNKGLTPAQVAAKQAAEDKKTAKARKTAAKKTPEKKAKTKATKKAKAAAPTTGKRAELHAKRIKVIISKNPKREGTAAYKKFEVYKTAKTVGEALEKGAKVGFRMSTINYDLKHKFIQLV